jgi:hypothetical protein
LASVGPEQEADDRPAGRLGGWLIPLVVAGAPAVGYLLAFSYEVGRTGVYDMPWALIAPQLYSVILGTLAVLAMANGVYIILTVVAVVPPRDWSTIPRLGLLGPPAVLGVLSILIFEWHWEEWIWAFVPFLLLAALDVGLPLITERKTRGFRAKLNAFDKRPFWSRAPISRTRIGAVWTAAYLLLPVAIYLTYAVGRSIGLDQETYLVVASGNPTVVLRIYGDKAIAAPYDPATHRLKQQFQIIDLRQGSPLLRLEKVGKLARDCHPLYGCHNTDRTVGAI